ncbi:hypothetical protein CEXT_168641 [Caerostris extrusa]|uniref:Uncharacterized protein n=1 Tax=Caerostris extrusa TaxID=172846 RepID=A0AAV4W3X9_CAEEX|nr:hypothetical protein CEXT_168641 [Caerostris extrusa]
MPFHEIWSGWTGLRVNVSRGYLNKRCAVISGGIRQHRKYPITISLHLETNNHFTSYPESFVVTALSSAVPPSPGKIPRQ